MKYESCLFVLFLAFNIPVFCQDTLSDKYFVPDAVKNSAAFYHQSFGIEQAIYNGYLYPGYNFKFQDGHPFYYSEDYAAGSVVYDDIKYDSVILQYDEVIDQLIAVSPLGKIILFGPKISKFSIYNSIFIPLKNPGRDTVQHHLFYNLLYQGRMMLLRREQKFVKEVIVSNTEIHHFIDTKKNYYIVKNGQWQSINSKKDFFKIVNDHREEVKAFIKSKKLNFKKDKSNMLTQAIAYYEKLR